MEPGASTGQRSAASEKHPGARETDGEGSPLAPVNARQEPSGGYGSEYQHICICAAPRSLWRDMYCQNLSAVIALGERTGKLAREEGRLGFH